MRVNCHAHLFNAASVFTPKTISILLNRLGVDRVPQPIISRLAGAFKEAPAAASRERTEDMEFKVLKEFTESASLAEYCRDLPDLDETSYKDIKKEGMENFEKRLLAGRGRGLAEFFSSIDAGIQSPFDFLEFLQIALQPGIKYVTDWLMKQLKPDEAVVALTMDITEGGGANGALWQGQIKETSAQVLAYPGRILPFVCVNPQRDGHLEIMKTALEKQGFVGVKLYPSLGYDLDSDDMRQVYDYCFQHDTPITVHCNRGGFYATKADIDRGHPEKWRPILEDYPGLKVCFAHFGGEENLTDDHSWPGTWTGTILELMKSDSGAGVYADISHHTDNMKGGSKQRNYFERLSALLADETWGRRILFGSDFWLVRLFLRESSYWDYFRSRLSQRELKLTAEDNPADFLGLPLAGRPCASNIARYRDFVAAANIDPQIVKPAPWLLREIKKAQA